MQKTVVSSCRSAWLKLCVDTRPCQRRNITAIRRALRRLILPRPPCSRTEPRARAQRFLSLTWRSIVISLLPAPMNSEDLMVIPIHAYDDCPDSIKIEHTSRSLIARIQWCQKQQMNARTEGEREEWCAEEDGLKDALLQRDRTDQYQYSLPAVLERYVTGLEDGRVLIRAVWIETLWQPAI
jgi:hypothetical protein